MNGLNTDFPSPPWSYWIECDFFPFTWSANCIIKRSFLNKREDLGGEDSDRTREISFKEGLFSLLWQCSELGIWALLPFYQTRCHQIFIINWLYWHIQKSSEIASNNRKKEKSYKSRGRIRTWCWAKKSYKYCDAMPPPFIVLSQRQQNYLQQTTTSIKSREEKEKRFFMFSLWSQQMVLLNASLLTHPLWWGKKIVKEVSLLLSVNHKRRRQKKGNCGDRNAGNFFAPENS